MSHTLRLSIVTAVCGAVPITRQWFQETIARCSTEPEVILVSNGNTDEEVRELYALAEDLPGSQIVEAEKPLGSTIAFNLGLRQATGDVVAMLHNDLMVKEPGWDSKLLAFFEAADRARIGHTIGVCGFHGSKELAHPLLYQIPYDFRQLARNNSYSNMEDAESHGQRALAPVEVATLDGMALIARRQDFLAWGGLDQTYRHHMYDHDLCLTAHRHGRRNYMLPILVKHVSGQTANASRYNDHLKESGWSNGDLDIHRKAHADFYEKWRGTGMLPARVT